MKIKIRAATDTGKVRDHNEDNFLVLEGEQSPSGIDALLVVADGMGGHAAGEVASQMTVEEIPELLRTRGIQVDNLEDAQIERFFADILEDVNRSVWKAGQDPDKRGMGTTCTLAALRGNQAFLAHVGDSRAYLLRGGKLNQLTTDHSWVEEAVSDGRLNREEARIHPNRNLITRAIGLDREVQVDTYVVPLLKDDLLLLCSDGLNSMITDEEIQKALKENKLDKSCQALIQSANKHGGHDNTTVVSAYIKGKMSASTSTIDNEVTQKIGRQPSALKRLVKKVFKNR